MSNPQSHEQGRDFVEPQDADTQAKPVIVWDAVVSAVLLLLLVFEMVGLLDRLIPGFTNWLTVVPTYVAIALVIGAVLVVIVRVIHRRISFWTVLIFLVVSPLGALLGALMLLAAALHQ